jgi:hypothetical protein
MVGRIALPRFCRKDSLPCSSGDGVYEVISSAKDPYSMVPSARL